ncbi:hypothetical protein GGR26_003450 [Lewinella marina]|uniref:DUF4407 domain-containing protein n=1 Tax=Neolewinella marina TaxID=438751 RepID=A0A2G0CCG0_9BACT|nr:DUF4407 domain-containing protein [Neolewinella marina]NJB87666.1 hypothetical protein [Neolewinella marina]PHK97651.1 hypothetical protein CGL56_14560 [Neolewinella marina]
MNHLKAFFLFCSGVDLRTLERVPTDENKYLGIGGTILFTGIMAFLSAGYAMYTIFDSYWLAAGFGLLWGLMIFNLDRYIVSSMKSGRGFFRNVLVALPRIGMTVLLAIVIAKPLELKIFEKEIDAELVVMEQEVFQTQEDRIRGRYAERMAAYEADLATLEAELTEKVIARDAAAAAALAEADGTGGSGIRNMGPIYRAKQDRAAAAQAELEATRLTHLPRRDAAQSEIAGLRATIDREIAELDRGQYGGLAARIAALDRLSQGSRAIALAVLFVNLLFIAIETAPIFTKLIAPAGPYDYVMAEYEQGFEVAAKDTMTVRATDLKNRIRYHTEVGVYRTTADIAAKKAEIDADLRRRREELGAGDFGLG